MQKFWQKLRPNFRWALFLFAFLALFATIQSYFHEPVVNASNGLTYTRFNNYIIFKQSFFHLLACQDLYINYPLEQWDLFKYSPAFALLFGLLALMPDFFGLLCWNLLNAGLLAWAVRYLPGPGLKAKTLLLATIAVELLTSLQNEQSNGLMAGLIILAFGLLERRKFLWATGCLVLSVYIKLFGLVAFVLFLFYQPKWKLAGYSLTWSLLFLLLPLLVVDAAQLLLLYRSWLQMLGQDHALSYGFSVMGWLHTWFGLDPGKTIVLAVGVVLLLLPLARFSRYKDYHFRLQVLASLLVWMVIFNHKAESPSFIIAMSGVGLWYFSQETKPENRVLLVLAILFTVLAPTDIYPRFIRNLYFKPYVVKAIPCILVWCKISYELLLGETKPRVEVPVVGESIFR
jgi:hypothetical protein